MHRVLPLLIALALAAPAASTAADGTPRHVKADRAAIGALLDKFIPDVVAGKNLKEGWTLVGGAARTVSYRDWIRGDTSIQHYPAKGRRFHGFVVSYSYPGDVGFDILVQPTKKTIGAWSFRAEAQKIGGLWKITTWYPVAEFAPVGKVQLVDGPNDFGAADSAATASAQKGREPPWVLLIPVALILGLLLVGGSVGGARWARRRGRVRAIERRLAEGR
jgi:hypothetical protein